MESVRGSFVALAKVLQVSVTRYVMYALQVYYDLEDGLIVVYLRCVTSAYYSIIHLSANPSLSSSHIIEQVSGWEAKWCSHRFRRF